MDQAILEGIWKEIRGKTKVWWSMFSGTDLDTIAARFDVLVGVLQDKYGLSRRQAVQEVSQWVIEYRAELRKKRQGQV